MKQLAALTLHTVSGDGDVVPGNGGCTIALATPLLLE